MISHQVVALAKGVLKGKSVSQLTFAITMLLPASVGFGAAMMITKQSADPKVERVPELAALALAEDGSSAQTPAGQKPMTAMEAWEHVQHKRAEAIKLWQQKEPSIKDLERAKIILEKEVIPFLDRPQIMELSRGNLWLRFKRQDVYGDLVLIHFRLGQKKQALDWLGKFLPESSETFAAFQQNRSDWLASLPQDEAFKEIDKKYELQMKRWRGAGFQTPYKENLGEDEKIAGLSVLWSQVKYNFANFDLVPDVEWDKLYLAYLPKVRETKNTLEYYRVLKEMCARLKDGHTNVYVPKELEDELSGRPPLRTALIEDKAIIVEVLSASLREKGIRPGFEIVQIDGVSTREYAEKRVAPYESASTKQGLQMRTFTQALLCGAKNKPVELVLADEKGEKVTKTLDRGGYTDVDKPPPPVEFKVLRGNVGYLALRSFGNIIEDDHFDDIAKTDALILDVRDNGGGSDTIGYHILGWLTDKPFKTLRWKTLDYRPAYQAWDGGDLLTWDGESAQNWPPDGKRLYSRPVVVLTSARTYSAAESFCVAFDYMKRGKIIGEPTGGSTGQPLLFGLPGGGRARVCVKRDSYPDGKEFVGIGIQPDVVIRPTLADVRAGRDTVLDGALEHLLKTSSNR